jgi:hypothetical protein
MTDPLKDPEDREQQGDESDAPSFRGEDLDASGVGDVGPDDDGLVFGDLSKLMADNPVDVDVPAIKAVYSVKKPHPDDFFRAHPSDSMTIPLVVYISKDGKTYYVEPAVREAIARRLRVARLVVCSTMDNEIVLWPVKMPTENGGGSTWYDSAWAAVLKARDKWIRIDSDMSAGQYVVTEKDGPARQPLWPEGESLETILGKAFKGRVIKDLNHPVVKRLKGEVGLD